MAVEYRVYLTESVEVARMIFEGLHAKSKKSESGCSISYGPSEMSKDVIPPVFIQPDTFCCVCSRPSTKPKYEIIWG